MDRLSRQLSILEEMQQRISELTEEVKPRDAFIAFAGHELRHPITPVIGQVEFLLSALRMGRCPPGQFERRLVRLKHIVRHYVKRAAVLLDVSRILEGQLQVEPTPLDLVTLLHDVVAGFASQAERAGLAITVTAPETPPGVRDRIFARFGRAADRSGRRSGFGVGSWVVRQLAGAMGGTVATGDAPGGGALLTVTLPQRVQGACP